MRISYWISDVCSSDLVGTEAARDHADEASVHRAAHDVRQDRTRRADERAGDDHRGVAERKAHRRRGPARIAVEHRHDDRHVGAADREDRKSNTSELQSLMRISYAVLCLKKKKNRK